MKPKNHLSHLLITPNGKLILVDHEILGIREEKGGLDFKLRPDHT